MAKPWSEIEQSEEYNNLPEYQKLEAKKQYWDNIISQEKNYLTLPEPYKEQAKKQFLGSAYEGEITSKKSFQRKFSQRSANVGQFVGGLGGGVLGGFFGHPYLGGAVGGTAGRTVGRVLGRPQMLLNPIARKKLGEEILTTAGIETAVAPLSIGGVKLGRNLVKTFIPKTVAERGLQGGFRKLLKPEYYKENLPPGFVTKVSDMLDIAKNKYGEAVENVIKQPYYQKYKINLGSLKNNVWETLKKLGIDSVPDIDKIDTISTRDREILKQQVRGVLNLTKEKSIPGNLWEARKALDKVIYSKSWKEEGLEILNGLRKSLNEPLRNAGKDIAKSFDEYSFIMQGKEALGKITKGTIERKATQETFSQSIENFVKTLMSPEKSETRRLLTAIDPEFAKEMFDVASAKVLGRQFIPGSPYSTLFGKFVNPKAIAQSAEFMQRPPVRAIGKGAFRLLPVGVTSALTEEEE